MVGKLYFAVYVCKRQRRNATANRAGQKQHKYQFTHCAPPYRTLSDRPVRSSYHNAKECATEFAALRRKYSTKNRIVDRRAFSAKIEDRHDFSIFPIFYRQGMFFPSDLLYAQSIFNTEGISNEPDSHRQLHRAQAQGTESDAGATGRAAQRVQQDHLQVGEWSFP